jgi:hypothetical protein
MTFGTHSVSPPKPPDRIISRFRDNDGNSNLIAMNIPEGRHPPNINSTCSQVMFRQNNRENDIAQATHPTSVWTSANSERTFGPHGNRGNSDIGHRAPLERWSSAGDQGRVGCENLRSPTSDADPSSPPTASSLTPTNPHAEGRRARAAGLTEAENPYLWPPGAREDWAAGWMGEGL